MPYDSEGNFTRIHNWEDDRVNDIDIVTDHHDEEDDNFADALSSCFLRDGRSAMRGDINSAGFKIKNLGAGTLSGDAVNRGQLDNAVEDLKTKIIASLNGTMGLGDIKASLKSANHGNWLLCDGQAVSRTDYAELFELIGTNFGAGDGINTFNIPDYRGKFLRGLGGNAAADIYTTQAEGLPNITGGIASISNGDGKPSYYAKGAFEQKGTFNSLIGRGSASDNWGKYYELDASLSSEVYGASEHVTPVNMAVNYFIKAKED